MITGTVSAELEARIELELQGAGGQSRRIDAILDTGFTGFLTLSPALLTALGAPWVYRQEGMLADGSIQVFDVHAVTVLWDGRPRTVEVEAIDADPLLGMALLEGHDLHVAVVAGGAVTIQARP